LRVGPKYKHPGNIITIEWRFFSFLEHYYSNQIQWKKREKEKRE